MTETNRVGIDIDDRCLLALQEEADRLGVGVEQVIQRAMSAWLSDIRESCMPTVVVGVGQ